MLFIITPFFSLSFKNRLSATEVREPGGKLNSWSDTFNVVNRYVAQYCAAKIRQ